MDGKKSLGGQQRAELRRQWIRRAVTVFEQMFNGADAEELVTFTQREQMACTLGKELSRWLLEQQSAADPLVHPPDEPAPRCPKCGRAGQRVTRAEMELPQRQLTTLVGEVTLRREQWRCATCRVAFFPSGPQAPAGDGRVQSLGPAESGPASS